MKKGDPLLPSCNKFDVYAIQALEKGIANDAQQKRALAYIVNVLCGTYDLSFRPGGEEGRRDTDFSEGKRFVGLRLVTMMKLTASAAEQLGPKND